MQHNHTTTTVSSTTFYVAMFEAPGANNNSVVRYFITWLVVYTVQGCSCPHNHHFLQCAMTTLRKPTVLQVNFIADYQDTCISSSLLVSWSSKGRVSADQSSSTTQILSSNFLCHAHTHTRCKMNILQASHYNKI